MKRSTTIVFVLLAAAVGAIVLWDRRHGTIETPEDPRVEVFTFGAVEVRKIELKRPKGDVVVVEKRGDHWWMTQPRDLPANEQNVFALLNAVEPMNAAERVVKSQIPSDPAVHSLDTPLLDVALTAADGKTLRLLFGKSIGSESRGRVYVRRGGTQEVLMMDEIVLKWMDKSFSDLRDPGLCRFDLASLDGADSTFEKVDARLTRNSPGWILEGATQDFADPMVVGEWAAGVAGLATNGFEKKLKASPSDYGLDAPRAKLAVRLKDRTVTVLVGAPIEEGSPRRWVEVSDFPGEIATIRESDVPRLVLKPDELRSQKVFPFPMQDVTGYEATGGPDLKVVKASGKWTLVRPPLLADFFEGRMDELVGHLAGMSIAQRLPVSEAPPGAISIMLTWGKGDAAVSVFAKLWSDGTNTNFLTQDPPRLVQVSISDPWDHVNAGSGFLRNPLVIDLVPLQVKRFLVEKAGREEFDATFDGREWALATAVPGKALDQARIGRLNVLWASLLADTWTRDSKDADVTGLKSPSFRVTIEPDAGKVGAGAGKARVILVGAPGPRETRYAMVEGGDSVFLIRPDAAAALVNGVWKD